MDDLFKKVLDELNGGHSCDCDKCNKARANITITFGDGEVFDLNDLDHFIIFAQDKSGLRTGRVYCDEDFINFAIMALMRQALSGAEPESTQKLK